MGRWAIGFMAMMSLLSARAVWAEQVQSQVALPSEPGQINETSVDTANLTGPTDPTLVKLLQDIGTKPARTSESERQEWSALKSFYSQPGAGPLWVGGNGLATGTGDVIAELEVADTYGLDPGKFAVPALPQGPMTPDSLARAELNLSRAVLKYARHAKGGRAQSAKLGSQLTEGLSLLEPTQVLAELKASPNRVAYLRGLHPKHPEFEGLRQKLAQLRKESGNTDRIKLPEGPVLRLGVSHPNVTILRKKLGLTAQPGSQALSARFDQPLEAAVKQFQGSKGLAADGIVGPGTRQAINADGAEATIQRILVNMERWRWLPDDLAGDAGQYVWANIPEFRVQVISGEKTVFSERAIVGKLNKQTPVFSDSMEWIEIHPTWYVPNSIKVEDILPSLRRSTSRIMNRYHLRMDCGPNGRDPAKVDWNRVDIRTCSFSQPPGEKSVLGDFKFKFPNKHAVYMHDTLLTKLFNGKIRTYSHGCLRIENPRRMAEALLAHDKSMSADQIGKILSGPKRLHKEELNKPVPVHIIYFTAGLDENGDLITRPDYYGHDRRLADVLTGKGHLLPAAQTPGRRARTVRRRARPPAPTESWWEQITMQN